MLFGSRKANSPRLQQLKGVSLFQDLAMHHLRLVESLLHERSYLRDEIIFDEGEAGQGLFVVLSGRVRTHRPSQPGEFRDFVPGSFFGELALLEDLPRSTQARAAEDTVLMALFRADFLSLLERHSFVGSKISYQLARSLARRLRMEITGNMEAHDG